MYTMTENVNTFMLFAIITPLFISKLFRKTYLVKNYVIKIMVSKLKHYKNIFYTVIIRVNSVRNNYVSVLFFEQ